MAVCKQCQQEVPRIYFTLNTQFKSVYKDDKGQIWHGKVCATCHKENVRIKANKAPKQQMSCPVCSVEFKQKVINQLYCSKTCRLQGNK